MIEFPPLNENQEITEELISNRVKEIDALIPSPEQRAASILKQIQLHRPEYTNWDVICFCSEYLGMMVDVLPSLENEIKTVATFIQLAHYRQPEIITGATSGV